jgi:hypothetical protein
MRREDIGVVHECRRMFSPHQGRILCAALFIETHLQAYKLATNRDDVQNPNNEINGVWAIEYRIRVDASSRTIILYHWGHSKHMESSWPEVFVSDREKAPAVRSRFSRAR